MFLAPDAILLLNWRMKMNEEKKSLKILTQILEVVCQNREGLEELKM